MFVSQGSASILLRTTLVYELGNNFCSDNLKRVISPCPELELDIRPPPPAACMVPQLSLFYKALQHPYHVPALNFDSSFL